ncbi:MAG: MBG domain-containing protein [Candidatus Pelethousia sp.]|nr:MBG domain-containing protein [Candidatus Pelethousia sp.]
MAMNTRKPYQKLLAMTLSFAMLLGLLPMTAFAQSGIPTMDISGEIIAFEPLTEPMANQTVPLNTSLDELNLPETLTATVRVATATDLNVLGKEEAAQDSGEPNQRTGLPLTEGAPQSGEGEGAYADPAATASAIEPGASEPAAQNIPQATEMTISIPVEWVSSPGYDGEKTGTYIFTPQTEGITASAVPPSIAVAVGEITGIVMAFEELPDEIRWQNTAAPTFPETADGTVEGEAVQIPVTWKTEQGYDENAPERGLYVFDAVMGEGYLLAGDTIAPRITVYIPETISRFAPLRMGGGGTAASPLEITTAAQLAEVAVLANAGRLESFLLNSTGNVSLKLMSDLDLSGYGQGYSGGKGWVPIGTAANPFKGSFDGNNKNIDGLFINDSGLENVGLFGSIEGGTIENLILSDAYVLGLSEIGGIAGRIKNTTVKKCGITGSVSGGTNIGGVVGALFENSSVENCYSVGNVNGTGNIGNNAGGIAGSLFTGTSSVQNCYSTMAVKGEKWYAGGIAGYGSKSTEKVKDCAALGPSIDAQAYTGRVAGWNAVDVLSGNIAFSGMMGGSFVQTGPAEMDGESMTAAEIKADGTIGGRFTTANGWIVENGKLPGFSAAVDMPEHIRDNGYFDGSGTEGAPYIIETATQLAKLAELVNAGNIDYNNKYYKLTSDIDLSGYGTSFNRGRGWMPIGNNTSVFSGSFDGGGCSITGLYINDAGLKYAGLFGDSTGSIHDLRLEAVYVKAEEKVGGIVGQLSYKDAKIDRCSVSGTITGKYDVGGIAGHIFGTTTNCFSACNVTGEAQVGGVVGATERVTSQDAILNCYATGTIIGSGNHIGGIVGQIVYSNVRNCAALNPAISGLSYFVGRVAGRNQGTLSGNVAFSGMTVTFNDDTYPRAITSNEAGLDGADITDTDIKADGTIGSRFTIANGWTAENGKLPGLFGKTVVMPSHISGQYFAGGTGSYSNPYQIATGAQLAKLAELVNAGGYDGKYYRLTADIDLSGYGKNYGAGKGWAPIGTEANPFRGEFDGNGKVISGLYINRPDEDYIGLFGYISHAVIDYMREPSSVRNLGIVNANITGKDIVGGLAGQFGSGEAQFNMVDNYVTGNISGNNNVGGLVGYVDWTDMASCYTTAMVTGNDNIGGLLGYTYATAVQSCYATGVITGNHNIGGLVGEVVSSLVQHCYSIGSVNGNDYIGGMAGYVRKHDGSFDGSIKNCAALNPSVSGSAANIGRIAGTIDNSTLVSNYAFSAMKVNSSTVSSTDRESKNGADMTVAQSNTAGFWTDASIFITPWPDWEYWTFANGKLPTLKRIPGQSGDGGVYLAERDITNATVEITGSLFTYTGFPIEPTLTVIFDGEALVRGTDYIIEVAAESASNGTSAGAVTAKLVGKGNFKGEKSGLSYTIQPKPLTEDMLATAGFSYTGKAQKPAVTDGATTLAEGVDYTAAYTNNTNAGTATMHVTGKGNYSGTLSKPFTIAKAPLTIIGGTVAAKTYNGYNTAYVTDVNFGGLQNSETLALGDDYTVSGAQFDSADAGENKALTAVVALKSTEITGNYTLTSENLSLTDQRIAKANATGVNQTIDVLTNCAKNYDFALTTLLPTISSPRSLGVITYLPSITANTDSILDTLNYSSGNTLIIPVNSVKAADKTATITVTVSSTNYKDFAADITVKTMDVTPLAVTGLTVVSKIYDGTTAATLRGTAALDTANVQDGDEVVLSGNPTATFGNANAGTGKAVIITGLSLAGKDAAKYGLDFSGVTGVIIAKPLANTMVTLSGSSFTYTGSVHAPGVTVKDGSETLVADTDYTVGYADNINAGTATVTIIGKGNYSGTASKTFTIAPKSVAITPAANQSKAYGETDPMLTFANDSELNDSAFTGALSREPGEDVGNYKITLGTLRAGGNYNLALSSPPVNFSITKKVVTITPASGRFKSYGSDDPDIPFANDGGLLATAFMGKLSRAPGENVGDYIITLGTLSAGNNYTLSLSSSPVTFSINQAIVTITPISGQNKVYGASDPMLGYTVFPDLVDGDSLSGVLSREPGEDVGDYKITLGTLRAGSNYSLFLHSQSVNFAIIPKAVTITPTANQSKVYGALDPILSFANDGGIPAAAFTGKLSRTAGENVGSYVINLGNLTAGNNYTLSLSSSPVTFRITKKSVTVTPNDGQGKIYGAIDPTLAFTNNGGLAHSDFTGALSRATGENVGDYAITLGTLHAGGNYELSLASGAPKFTIEQAAVQSINTAVSNVSKTAYEMRNVTTAQAVVNMAGLPEIVSITTDSDNVAALPILWSTTTLYNAKGAIYQVTGTLVGNANIDAGSVTKNVTVTVTPITAVNPVFGDTTVLVNSHSGSASASTLEAANILHTSGSISIQGEDIGYTISWSGGPLDTTLAGNNITFNGTISYPGAPAWLTLPSGPTVSRKVTVVDKTPVTIGGVTTPNKAYDGTSYVPAGTVTCSHGFPINQLEWLYESTDGAGYKSSSTPPTNAGAYKLTISVPESNANYAGSMMRTFIIEKRQITLAADNKTVVKGASLPQLTYTISNLPSGKTKADALRAEPVLACPTFDGAIPGSYTITLTGGTATDNFTIAARANGTLTVAEQTYAVTVNGSYASPTGAGSYAKDTTVNIYAGNRSNYTFTGWTSSDVTITGASSRNASFVMPAKTVTVTANWSYSGGGDNGGGSYIPPTTAPSATPPSLPAIAAASVTATGGANGIAHVNIPASAIADAIAGAQSMQGSSANGISVELNVTMPQGVTSLTAAIPQSALQSLVTAAVNQLAINGAPVSLGLNQSALQSIQSQASGGITIGMTPVTGLSAQAQSMIGSRPVYEITISYKDQNGETQNITSLGSGTATLAFPYVPGRNEATGYLFGAYVDVNGNASRISGSVYDANSRSVLIPTNHLSVYGVGYSAPSAKFTDIGSHWAKESIDYAVGRGLLCGTSKTTFAPDSAITQGMLVTALGRLAGVDTKAYTKGSLSDVKADGSFRPYIEWAYSKGIVQDIGNNQLAPDHTITREEIAVIFSNFVKTTGYTLPVTREAITFTDNSSIGSNYMAAVKAMQQAGIMMGDSGNRFNPKAGATRAEVAAMLHRYVKLIIDPATAQGWAKNDDGRYMYFKDGVPLAGRQTINGKKYYFYGTGVLR